MPKERFYGEILKYLKEILGDEILKDYLNENFDKICDIYFEDKDKDKKIKNVLKKCKDYIKEESKNNFKYLIKTILQYIICDITEEIYFDNRYFENKIEKFSKPDYIEKEKIKTKYENTLFRDLYSKDKKYKVWMPFFVDFYIAEKIYEFSGKKQIKASLYGLSTSCFMIKKVINNLGLSDEVIVKDTEGENKYGKIDELRKIYEKYKIKISVIEAISNHVICVDGRGKEPVIYCSYYHFYETENQSSFNNIYDEKFLKDNIKYFSKESFKQNNKSSTCPLIATLYAKLLSEGKTENLQQKALNYDLPSKLKYILVDSLDEDKIGERAKSDVLEELEEKVDGKQEITM